MLPWILPLIHRNREAPSDLIDVPGYQTQVPQSNWGLEGRNRASFWPPTRVTNCVVGLCDLQISPGITASLGCRDEDPSICSPNLGAVVQGGHPRPPQPYQKARGLTLEPLQRGFPGPHFTTQSCILLRVSDKEGVLELRACFCPLRGCQVQYLLVNT